MNALSRFDISPKDGAFVLQLEDKGGKMVSLTLTAEQLDALIEAADELLDDNDAVHELEQDNDQT